MERPQRVLPVIDYETPTPSPLTAVVRMLGWMAIAMGVLWLLMATSSVLKFFDFHGNHWDRRQLYSGAIALADLMAAFALLTGGTGCLCLKGWGKVLLLFIACVHPIAQGTELFISGFFGARGPELWVYPYLFFYGWLPLAVFPLMAFVLLVRPDIRSVFVGGEGLKGDLAYGTCEQATRLPLRAANRALCCFAILYGAFFAVLTICELLGHFPSNWNLKLIAAVVLWAILLFGSIGCLFLQPWASVLLLLFSVLWPLCYAFPMISWTGSTLLRRLLFTAERVMQPAPFTLVIFMFFLNRHVRALFSRRPDQGTA